MSQKDMVLEEISTIKNLFNSKNEMYRVSPIEMLPLESWLHQIRIKSERAIQSIDKEKRKDEIRDCAVYCILALAKIRGEELTENER